MGSHVLILGLVPLVLYVVVTIWKGVRAGIITAMVSYIVLFFYFYLVFGIIDEVSVLEGVLILGLGGVALKFNNSVYFKFQPVVVNAFLAAVFGWFQLADEPFLLKFMPRMKVMIPEIDEMLKDPGVVEALSNASAYAIFGFLLHGGIVSYTALRSSNTTWLFSRFLIYPILFVVMLIGYV